MDKDADAALTLAARREKEQRMIWTFGQVSPGGALGAMTRCGIRSAAMAFRVIWLAFYAAALVVLSVAALLVGRVLARGVPA